MKRTFPTRVLQALFVFFIGTLLSLVVLRTAGVLADVGNAGQDGYTEEAAPTTCFVKGTMVSTPDGERPIESLGVGDEVLSWDERARAFRTGKITFLDRPRLGSRKIYAINGGVRATSEHPFYARTQGGEEGWRSVDPSSTARENETLEVGKLAIGDFVLREDGSWEKVESVSVDPSHSNPEETLYNFGVDGGTPTYVADGYVVHNKEAGSGEDEQSGAPSDCADCTPCNSPSCQPDVCDNCVTSPTGNQSYRCSGGWCTPVWGGGGSGYLSPPPGWSGSGKTVPVRAAAVIADKRYMSRCGDLVQIKTCLETGDATDCMIDGQPIVGEKRYPVGLPLIAIWGINEKITSPTRKNTSQTGFS